ncbi:MAG: hypothetical protein ABI580_00710 [Burkholderiaceae bacterium]
MAKTLSGTLIPSLYLSRCNLPLDQAWEAEQIARLTSTERARLARISRPQRRAQFVVAHCTLRWGLAAAGLESATIEVDSEGRPRVHASVPVYASIAHSADFVAAMVAGDPIGVDLESTRRKHDLSATAALLGLSGDGSSDATAVLRAWVTAEARLKAGAGASPYVWLSTWEACQLAVAGSPSPPLTGVFDGMAGIYNATVLRWEAV